MYGYIGGYIGIMEKKMDILGLMENQMEKKMENEMETTLTVFRTSCARLRLMTDTGHEQLIEAVFADRKTYK